MGEKAFSLCDSKLIECNDILPILQIDMVWTCGAILCFGTSTCSRWLVMEVLMSLQGSQMEADDPTTSYILQNTPTKTSFFLLISKEKMDEYMWNYHVPAFGGWDYEENDLPYTQCILFCDEM
ncbi:uncharacterized protein LOC110702861 [Chenopodium quinoa]|uniref:uncharacterized protein LOC110702861 n=1 Tax=Chenopodium quinoa TaxID=63459 RepID=UPI000B781350|nr:uncharacterized protein LOC110702861 [Chenopodium quinoa]XP_021736297.1 uncharacterized protein LOC110702861 [Chenopodium quinoa]